MRIVVANKFWYHRGGLERVMFDEITWLEDAGHEVAHFSTRHPDNVPSPWEEFFAPYLELGADGMLSGAQKITAVARMFWNGVAYERFSALLDRFRPDVVHVHGIHRQLSASILVAARRRGVPVVQTVHDYHHVCPADTLLKGGDVPCDPIACHGANYTAAIRNRCVRSSLATSALAAAEAWARAVTRAYRRCVERFICPSEFLRRILVEQGWPAERCDVVRNAVVTGVSGATERPPSDAYFLYSGRLSNEKGVHVLLEAARVAGTRVVVAGDGPQAAELRQRFPDVAFLGRIPPSEVGLLSSRAIACVVPSVWLENAPMAVLEPMAIGVPVIASRIGGIPELIEDGVDGLLVPPNDSAALSYAMARLEQDADLRTRLGEAARQKVAQSFSPAAHLAGVVSSYEKAMRS